MTEPDLVQIENALVQDLGYSPVDAQLFLRRFAPLREPLDAAVRTWLEDGSVADVEVRGLSIKEVMKVRNCHFLMAVRYLNRALDPTVPEERRRRMIESLRQPVARW